MLEKAQRKCGEKAQNCRTHITKLKIFLKKKTKRDICESFLVFCFLLCYFLYFLIKFYSKKKKKKGKKKTQID